MPHDAFHVVRFQDGTFDEVRSFAMRDEAAGYSRGFVSGAGSHGWPRAFVLPDELKDLHEYGATIGEREVHVALEAVRSASERE